MAGWALHYHQNETAKTTPVASAFKNCTYDTAEKKGELQIKGGRF
jgi:hypothetical protein